MSGLFDMKSEQATWGTNSDHHIVSQYAIKKWENRKTKSLYVFFPGKHVFGDDGFQNIFVYQPLFNLLESKEDKTMALNMLLVGNQKEYVLLNLHHILLPSITLEAY